MTSPKRLAATGGGGPAIYVDDVFSTWLYTGNGSTQTIPNGIDLLGKGGMVWVKQRNGTYPNILSDTVRGLQKALVSNSTAAEDAITNGVTFPNGSASSTGFVLGSNTESNQSGQTFVSWTFREAPKFFDVVTYTGNGVAGRTVAHNLGSAPGCMIVRRYDGVEDWRVYHRSLGGTRFMTLNSTGAAGTVSTLWNNTDPTSTVFSLGTDNSVNGNGFLYVAYLFAHNAGGFGATGNDNVISCGSYTGNGSATGPTVTLGYEPQFLILKAASGGTSGSQDWNMVDNMRGWTVSSNAQLNPNLSAAETQQNNVALTSTGFRVTTAGADFNGNGNTYIYIAIRRGPMKTPTSGTSVFGLSARSGTGANATVTGSAGVSDAVLIKNRGSAVGDLFAARLTGTGYLETSSTAAEVAAGTTILQANPWDVMDGVKVGTTSTITNATSNTYINYLFDRAPGFFDVVCYTGTGNGQVINHNLGAVPELAIFKLRAGTGGADWVVRAPGTTTDRFLLLNSTNAQSTAANWYSATSTQITFPTAYAGTAQSGFTYVAYLFASLPGISQVGSYTGNGSSQTINCGFAAGARFVMIKRTDSTGDWYVWDTARGIVSGNDPRLSLNTTSAEVTTDDSIDPDSSGFIVNQLSATNINVNAASYIFWAVA